MRLMMIARPELKILGYRQEVEESEDQTDRENGDDGFKRTAKAALAPQLNLSAELSKEGRVAGEAG